MNLWWRLIHGYVSTSLAYNMLVGSWKLGGEEVLGKENYVGKERDTILLHIVEEGKTHVSQA